MNPGKTTGSKDDRTKIRGIVGDIALPKNVKIWNSTKWLTGTQGDELMCSGWVLSSYSTSGTRRVTIKHPVIKQHWGNDGIVITTSGTYHVVICQAEHIPGHFSHRTYPWSFVTQNTSLVICHTEHIPGHLSRRTYPWSFVTQNISLVICHTEHIPGHLSRGTYPWSFVTQNISVVNFHTYFP